MSGKRPSVTALVVLYREGERAKSALEPFRRLARRVVLIHDGPVSFPLFFVFQGSGFRPLFSAHADS